MQHCLRFSFLIILSMLHYATNNIGYFSTTSSALFSAISCMTEKKNEVKKFTHEHHPATDTGGPRHKCVPGLLSGFHHLKGESRSWVHPWDERYIYLHWSHKNQENVGEYTIHGSSGYIFCFIWIPISVRSVDGCFFYIKYDDLWIEQRYVTLYTHMILIFSASF